MSEDNDEMYMEFSADPVEDHYQDDEFTEPEPEPEQDLDQSEITRLAREVLAGKHGRGEARKASLGDMYEAVQKEVLRLRVQGA